MPRARLSPRSAQGAVLLSTCALALLVPQIADACGASEPELSATVPVDGETYPGNAALLFSGVEISLDAVTVTVDGAAAALVPAGFAAGFATIAARVEPAPQEGQTVVVAGSFCDGGELCAPVTITYTAGPDDVTAPEPVIADTFFTVYDHGDILVTEGCSELTVQQMLYVHLRRAPQPGAGLVLFEIAWDPDGDGQAGFRRVVRMPDEEFTTFVPIEAGTLGGKDPLTDVCIEVRATDTANNAAPPFEVCPPCFFREDAGPIPSGLFPQEPTWTDDDAVPGSACAVETPTTGDDDPSGGTGDPSGDPSEGTSGDTSGGTEDSASGGEDEGPEKGCACRGSGGVEPGDFGRLVLLAAGLGLGLVRRRGRRYMAV